MKKKNDMILKNILYPSFINRCGYSGVAWVAVRPIKSNQWDAWVAVFFLKSVLFWANFRVKTRKNELI